MKFIPRILIPSLVLLFSGLRGEPDDSIFMGMELFVEVEGVEYPMIGFKNGLHLYRKDGELQGAPRPAKVNFKKTIRHSDHFARMLDFASRPYSTEVAVMVNRYMDAIQQQMNAVQPLDYALREFSNASAGGDAGPAGMSNVGAEIQRNQQVNVADATASVNSAMASFDSMSSMTRGVEKEMFEKSHEEHFDTLLISLKIQVEESLDDCFLFVRARYEDPEASEPKSEKFNIQITEIGPIRSGEMKPVFFAMTGFPEGPRITEMTYHLFSGNREVATDFSEQRLELSESEAYDFLYADLFSEIEPPDTDPELFKLLDPSHLPPGLSPDVLEEVWVSLTVLATGDVENIEVSRCPEESHAALEAAVRRARFLPAVRDGNPVDRKVAFPLADIIDL